MILYPISFGVPLKWERESFTPVRVGSAELRLEAHQRGISGEAERCVPWVSDSYPSSGELPDQSDPKDFKTVYKWERIKKH